MADKTGISWTDATWNPVTGCAKVSQGCRHCYAERDWHRMQHLPTYSGRTFTDVACHPERLDQPLRWRRPRMVFVNSMSDLFHQDVPDGFIDQVFAIMALANQHVFQTLTKRPDRMLAYLSTRHRQAHIERARVARIRLRPGGVCIDSEHYGGGNVWSRWPLPHVWIGVSVEDQATADERIPLLIQMPAAIRWVSAEPLLGPVDLAPWLRDGTPTPDQVDGPLGAHYLRHGAPLLDWVVVGGESGRKARIFDVAWARDLLHQCRASGVQFFMKQLGARPCGWSISSRSGADPSEWPEDLRVRQYPGGRHA